MHQRQIQSEKLTVIERLTSKNRTVDLSIALLKFQLLSRNAVNINREDTEYEKQVILISPRGSVLIMPDGRRVFNLNSLTEIEEYVKSGLRKIKTIQNDFLWALIVGLSGLAGLILAKIIPRLHLRSDKAKVIRFIDEIGDIVYIARSPDGNMAHLLTVDVDKRRYRIHEPLANSICRMGHYLIRLTYPASALTWKEVLGLEIDPKVEIIIDPTK